MLKELTFITRLVLAPIVTEEFRDEIQTPIPKPVIEVVEEVKPITFNMEATFYGPDCNGCSGITAAGYDVRNTIYVDGYRVIAVDPRIIPLNSIVEVELEDRYKWLAIAGDAGGDIKGMRIDILVESESESFQYGRKQVKVKVIE